MHADYAGKGIDQLARAIQTIKSNPEDRRLIVSAWCVNACVGGWVYFCLCVWGLRMCTVRYKPPR